MVSFFFFSLEVRTIYLRQNSNALDFDIGVERQGLDGDASEVSLGSSFLLKIVEKLTSCRA